MSEVLIISGAYGVGKSEFACQWALRNAPCVLADIDVINPYFRPRELTSWFEEKGIKIIGSSIKHHTNQDFPALSGDLGPALHGQLPLIIDCAGSAHGLRPLAGFKEDLKTTKLYLVVNKYRSDAWGDAVLETMDTFSRFLGIPLAGIINNSHLLDETTEEMLIEAHQECLALCEQWQVPLIATVLTKRFAYLQDKIRNAMVYEELLLRQTWMIKETL